MTGPHVGIVALFGAGNLGDDLIAACLIAALKEQEPDAEVAILDWGVRTDLVDRVRSLGARWVPKGRRRAAATCLSQGEAVLLGGGGLLQDTHHPFRPHQWLSYLRRSLDRGVPVSAVGLGVGPLAHAFNRRLVSQHLSRFAQVQVRDRNSQRLLAGFNLEASLQPDIVAGSSLSQYGFRSVPLDGWLGCSLREWPGLSVETAADALARRARNGYEGVRFFAFEHRPGRYAGEVAFLAAVGERLEARGLRTEHFVYGDAPLDEFADAMGRVELGVAMRFHANVLWARMGRPVVPIPYAPKVASLWSPDETWRSERAWMNAAFDVDPVVPPAMHGRYELPPLFAPRPEPSTWHAARDTAVGVLFDAADASYRVTRRLVRSVASRRAGSHL